MSSFDKLYNSFIENFKNGENDIERFQELFEKVSGELSKLNILDAFVDVSRKKDLIDFNLNLEEGLFLSVASNVNNTTDDVMFSVARNHKTLVIDIMRLNEIINRINIIIEGLKNVEDNKRLD